MSLHSASSLALSCVLNMSPTIDMPGDHCDIPPKSAWLNWAIRPPPAPESREHDLHRRRRDRMLLRHPVDQIAVVC